MVKNPGFSAHLRQDLSLSVEVWETPDGVTHQMSVMIHFNLFIWEILIPWYYSLRKKQGDISLTLTLTG